MEENQVLWFFLFPLLFQMLTKEKNRKSKKAKADQQRNNDYVIELTDQVTLAISVIIFFLTTIKVKIN